MGELFQEGTTSDLVVNIYIPYFIHVRLARFEDFNIFHRAIDRVLAETEAANFNLCTKQDTLF